MSLFRLRAAFALAVLLLASGCASLGPAQRAAGAQVAIDARATAIDCNAADACAQAHTYADAAHALGARAQVLPQDLSHQEINAQLGLDNAYTRQVEAFLRDISR